MACLCGAFVSKREMRDATFTLAEAAGDIEGPPDVKVESALPLLLGLFVAERGDTPFEQTLTLLDAENRVVASWRGGD